MLTWANLWLRAMPTIDSFRTLSKLGDALYEAKLQVKLGNSSDDRNTLAGVLMIIFKEITEQLPNEVGPSITALGTGNGWVTVITGRRVANISDGISVLKNRTVGSTANRSNVRRQPLPTETVMELLPIEHKGLPPSRAKLLAANKRPQENVGKLGKVDDDVTTKVSRPESHRADVNK